MAKQNDREEGGLFSDGFEVPKRENPYKKKKKPDSTDDRAAAYVHSEDRTAEIKRENPYRRRSSATASGIQENTSDGTEEREAPPVDESRAYRDRNGTHLPTHEKSLRERWSDFIFSHVKLICFIGGVILLLLFISAPAIYYGVRDAREQAEQESKAPLTLDYVMGLADKSEPITWQDLVSFPYDETVASDSVTWMLKVKNTDYEVWISGVSTRNLPTYVYLYDMRTGDKVDLTEGPTALERFLSGRE